MSKQKNQIQNIKVDRYRKYSSYKNSFLLGILGIIISIFSVQNKSLDFITYPLLTLSVLVILLGIWQVFQARKSNSSK